MRKFIRIVIMGMLSMLMYLSIGVQVFAADIDEEMTDIQGQSSEYVSALELKEYIANCDENYSSWLDSDVVFGYDLYSMDGRSITGKLFYVTNIECEGYIIVDCLDNTVVEFSMALPAYDLISVDSNKQYTYIYENAIPMLSSEGNYYYISMDGQLTLYQSDISLLYYPNTQSGNCIVGAISNLVWHYGKNGYSSLISGMTFSDVEDKVDTLITNEGGYANKNIPNTIKKYVSNKSSSYSVTVTNKWSPSFSDVSTETVSRPCLLGFAADANSPYSKTVGHMTVCVGTRTVNKINYVKVMDGWSTSVAEKKWGAYNDFISKVKMSK